MMTLSVSRVALATIIAATAALQATAQPTNLTALFLNRTATLARGVQGVGDALLSYGPPLAADLKADAAATAAGLAGVSFDPVTADWSKIYTGFPQPPTPSLGIENIAAIGDVKCLSNYALCAFANCTVSFKSKGVPVAECGCLPVRGGQNIQPDLPNGYAKDIAFSYVDSTAILDKKVRAESTKLCKNSGKCVDKGAGILSGEQFNVSPFCQEMQPSPTTKKPTLYGGMFDIISTFNPLAWTNQTVTGANQGVEQPPISCGALGGVMAYCETAACLSKTSFNGLPVTCYCPIYTFPALAPGAPVPQSNNFFVAGVPSAVGTAGCNGTRAADGTLQFLNNGGFLPVIA